MRCANPLDLRVTTILLLRDVRVADLDESLLLASLVVDEVAAVVAAQVLATETARPAPQVAARLGRRDHVERHRQRSALVDVVHPQAGPRELPLHIAVRLQNRRVPSRLTLRMSQALFTVPDPTQFN